MTLKESSQISPNHAVKLFGTKISVSVPEDRKAPQNSEDAQASNVDEFSASTSCSEDDKVPSLERPEQSEEQEDKPSRAGLKRPDKLVPCPRCNSLDTKFCYFNNYNVNQPRHFCKNCQRYWTAGGTLRNVPVGAGRRKNKGRGVVDPQENTETRQLGNTLSEKRQLVAGLASPKQGLVSPKQGLASHKPRVSSSEEASEGSNDSRDDSTCGSSSNPTQECRGSNSYSTTPLTKLNTQSLNGAPTRPPFPLVAGPIWNPAGNWTAAWNSPWANLAATAASAAAKAIAHNVGSLGKHIRDEETGSSRCSSVWAPKTLRIDASQWRTGAFVSDISVGNKLASISTGGMFKAFQQKSSASTRRTSDGTIDEYDITKVCEAGLDKQGDLGERVRNDGNTGDTS